MMPDAVISSIYSWLIQASLHASLIIVLIIIVRRFFESQLKPGWCYLLWLILLCRLLMPVPLSIELPEFLQSIHPLKLSQNYEATIQSAFDPQNSVSDQQLAQVYPDTKIHSSDDSEIKSNLFFIWLCGFLLLAASHIRKLILTSKHVNGCGAINDRRILNSCASVKDKLGFNRNVEIKLSNQITGPASFGLLRPVILLPTSTFSLKQADLNLILEHELVHHKRFDIAIDSTMALFKAAHWFNPLFWLAHRLMRADCELSCDYRVTLDKAAPIKQRYAELLIKFTIRKPSPGYSYSMILMSAKVALLSRRITHLLEQPKSSFFKTVQIASITACISVISLTTPGTSLAIKTVIFDYSISQGISDFSSKRQNQNVYLKNQEDKRISAELSRPSRKGKHPAIVLVHGCEGFDSRHEKWIKHLNNMGYITFKIQRKGLTTPYCEKPIAHINTFTAAQIMDAYAALDYLKAQYYVDVNNINIMSWESWSAIGAAATYGVGQVYLNKFNAAIAMYPDCTATYNGEFGSPLLILVGDSDQWARPDDCISIQSSADKTNSSLVKVKVYTNTFHGFDNQKLNQATFLPYAKNLGHLSATGTTAKYNHHSYLDSLMQIETFLSEHATPL